MEKGKLPKLSKLNNDWVCYLTTTKCYLAYNVWERSNLNCYKLEQYRVEKKKEINPKLSYKFGEYVSER